MFGFEGSSNLGFKGGKCLDLRGESLGSLFFPEGRKCLESEGRKRLDF